MIQAGARRIRHLSARFGEREIGTVLRGAVLFGLISYAGTGLTYLLQILLAGWIGASEFGVYAYALSWALLLAIPAGLGLPRAAIRFIPEYLARDDRARLRGFVTASLCLVAASAGAIALGALAVVALAPVDRLGDHYGAALMIALLCVPVLGLLNHYREMSRGFNWLALALAPRAIGQPVLLLVCVGGLVSLGYPVSATTTLWLMLGGLLVILAGQGGRFHARAAARLAGGDGALYESRLWLRVAVPLGIYVAVHSSIHQIDIVMIGFFRAPEDVAAYFAASRTAMLVGSVTLAINALGGPRIAHLHAGDRKADLQALVSGAAHWLFWPTLGLGAAIVLFGDTVLGLFGPEFVAAKWPLAVLIGAQVISAGAGQVGPLLNFTGHHDVSMRIMLAALLFHVVANLLLIPPFGIMGAALATAGSVALWNVWQSFEVRRRLGLRSTILAALVPARPPGPGARR